jgi:SAM-dependent methyltransferase
MYSHTNLEKNNTVTHRDAWIFAQEKMVLDRVLKNVRGNDLLQIGRANDECLIENARVLRSFFVDAELHSHHAMPFIQANADCLPVQTESIDIILLMHTLDVAKNPKAILQEAHRVLRSNGQLIILGFNQWSVSRFLHHQKKGYSAGKIKQYLRALDCDITMHQTLCFWPPSLLLETLGQFFLPYAGSIYLLVAQKNILGMTPLVVNNFVRVRTCEIK